MIFVTVGAQMPFDRMIRAVDTWAGDRRRTDVFAQIGHTDFKPRHIQWTAFIDATEFRNRVQAADVVVAHAGMGSILTALELGKPILVMPRRGDLRETRNDHQVATARRFEAQGRIAVAFDEQQLIAQLDLLDKLKASERIATHASPALLAALRAFISGQPSRRGKPGAALDDDSDELLERRSAVSLVTEEHRQSPAAAAGAGISRIDDSRALDAKGLHRRDAIKSRVMGMILLAGRLRTTDLARRIGRSRLDLPIDERRSLLTYWRDEALGLAQAWDIRHLPVRVLLDDAAPMPDLPEGLPGITVSLERDRSAFRGTGGVLRDVCTNYDDGAWILVANAAQMLFGSLADLADRLAAAGGDVNVVNDADGVPNGVMLVRCGALRGVPEVGFHDFKEQVIPSLAQSHRVRVVPTQGLTSHPIHSLRDYTEALRSYHAWRKDGGGAPWALERWQPQFSICEPGATVAPSAVICDSVIMRGAVVEKGAVVVRSVVGRSVRVAAGQLVCDRIVT